MAILRPLAGEGGRQQGPAPGGAGADNACCCVLSDTAPSLALFEFSTLAFVHFT